MAAAHTNATPANASAARPIISRGSTATARPKHASAIKAIAQSTAPAAGIPGTASRLMVLVIGS